MTNKDFGKIAEELEGKYEMRFQRIVILGNGKIAVDCLHELLNFCNRKPI